MNTADDIIERIGIGLQHPGATVIFVPGPDSGKCWRCVAANIGGNAVDLCDSCFEEMREWSK